MQPGGESLNVNESVPEFSCYLKDCVRFIIVQVELTSVIWLGHVLGRKEVCGFLLLFMDALNTYYLRVYGDGYTVNDYSAREETRGRHFMAYTFRLAAIDVLFASSNKPFRYLQYQYGWVPNTK